MATNKICGLSEDYTELNIVCKGSEQRTEDSLHVNRTLPTANGLSPSDAEEDFAALHEVQDLKPVDQWKDINVPNTESNQKEKKRNYFVYVSFVLFVAVSGTGITLGISISATRESTVNVYWTAWGAWGAWGQCSATCGTGLQTRRRNCLNSEPGNAGRDCFGDLSDYKLCNLIACSSGCFTTTQPTKTTITTTPTCPEDWIHSTNSCYYFSVSNAGFAAAQAKCEQDGAHLAYVENEEESKFIKQHIINKGLEGPFWIGLSDQDHEGVWKYYGTENVATFFDWATGEPNNRTNENCVELSAGYNYQWNDFTCTDIQKFVCEKDMQM